MTLNLRKILKHEFLGGKNNKHKASNGLDGWKNEWKDCVSVLQKQNQPNPQHRCVAHSKQMYSKNIVEYSIKTWENSVLTSKSLNIQNYPWSLGTQWSENNVWSALVANSSPPKPEIHYTLIMIG